MKTTQHPAFTCLCGYSMDCTSSLNGDAVPEAGDVSLCAKCGRLFIMTNGCGTREPTADELHTIMHGESGETIRRAQKIIRTRK